MSDYVRPEWLVEQGKEFCIQNIELRVDPAKPEHRQKQWFYTIIYKDEYLYETKFLTFFHDKLDGSLHKKNRSMAAHFYKMLPVHHVTLKNVSATEFADYTLTQTDPLDGSVIGRERLCPCHAMEEEEQEHTAQFEEPAMVMKYTIEGLRDQLGVFQYQLATLAGTTSHAVSRACHGQPVAHSELLKMLRLFNEIRETRGMAQLTEEDMEWAVK